MKHRKIRLLILIITPCSYGSPGDLDRSFGSTKTGIVITPLNRTARINDIQVDNNNKILVAGSTVAHTQGSFVARYTPEGILDDSFNESGVQELYIESAADWHSIIILPNNTIMAGGYVRSTQTNCALATFSQSGNLIPASDSTTGLITQLIGEGSCIRSLAVTKNGALIAGGTSVRGLPSGLILKYLPNGRLDSLFGNYGIVRSPFTELNSINKVVIQPSDEKIVAIGYVETTANIRFAIARYLPNGMPDLEFGTNGFVSTPIEYYANAFDIAFQPNGYMVVAGFTFDHETQIRKFAVARYDTQGNLDHTFNKTGVIVTPIQYSAKAHAVAVQPDDKIILGGTSQGNRATQFTLIRYNTDGSRDESFGKKGVVTTTVSKKSAGITSMTIQNGTTLLAAGYANNDITLARYLL